jgi:MarR family transcriptional regulator, organic hydroperoxide resistance regulator
MSATLPWRPAPLPAPSLGEDLDFLRLIWAVDHGLQTTSKQMERALGVTGPQGLVLRIIARFPGLTMARLALILRVHSSTAGGIVKRLERRGLVCRRQDPRDRRRAYLGLTETGRDFDLGAAGFIEAAVHRTLGELPRRTIEHARQTLTVLTRELSGVDRVRP